MPKLSDMLRRAEAARVIADFRVVQSAAFDRFAETGIFPRSQAWGSVPPELTASLPQGFTFDRGELVYRWRRWSLPNGLPRRRNQSALLGFEVRTSDRRLMQSIKGLYTGSLGIRQRDAYHVCGRVTHCCVRTARYPIKRRRI